MTASASGKQEVAAATHGTQTAARERERERGAWIMGLLSNYSLSEFMDLNFALLEFAP